MTEAEEHIYMEGSRAAWQQLYDLAARRLGYENMPVAVLASARERAVVALRAVCREYGDNDWPDDLDLSDIIDKHLHRHLAEGE